MCLERIEGEPFSFLKNRTTNTKSLRTFPNRKKANERRPRLGVAVYDVQKSDSSVFVLCQECIFLAWLTPGRKGSCEIIGRIVTSQDPLDTLEVGDEFVNMLFTSLSSSELIDTSDMVARQLI